MKKVKEEKPYITTKAKEMFPDIDFSDSFSTTNKEDSIGDIANLVFNTSPKWIEVLFKIRNKIVGFIGLKNDVPTDYKEGLEVGDYIKFFKIYYISENEMILGADDSHLNFRAIISNVNSVEYNIRVTTLVKYNNKKGRIYMKIIKPFHRLVVMKMVSNAYKYNKE